MSEFTGKNKKDLMKSLFDKRSALQKFRFESSGGKSINVKEGYALRKDIARILTEVQSQARTAVSESKAK